MSKFIYIDNIFQFEKNIWNTISKCNNIKYIDFNRNIFLNKGNYNYLYTDELGNEYYSSGVVNIPITQPTFNLPTEVHGNSPRIDMYKLFGNPWGKIKNINFHKIYLQNEKSSVTIKDPNSLTYNQETITNQQTSYNYSSNAQHITTYNYSTNYINMYAIVPETVPETISTTQNKYDIILSISLNGNTNINDWSKITNNTIEQTYNVKYTTSDASKNTYIYNNQDLYPHWESDDHSITYYGGLAKLLNLSNKKICINIDSNVHLPFGFSNSKFVIYKDQNHDLYNIVKKVITNNPIIHNIRFDNPSTELLMKVENLNKLLNSYNLSQYITSCTNSTPLNTITINGGIINGSIIKSSNCDWTSDKYSSHSYPYQYLAMPWNVGAVRADQLSVKNSSSLMIFQLLRSVEYWIFNGLLELYSNNIELNGVSVLCGMPRGIAPTQLNAYTHSPNASGYTTITNCQFCLNHYGQTDGLDILSDNVTYKNVYYQVADDTFKLASNNIKANNITIVSGANGGAINFGAYGTNTNSISADISHVFIHAYNKPNNKLTDPYDICPKELNLNPYCINSRKNSWCKEPFWPGPSIIFAPINPTNPNADKQNINIQYIYVNNNYNINLNSNTNDIEPYTFLVGGFMSILDGYTQCNNPGYKNTKFYWSIFNIFYNNIRDYTDMTKNKLKIVMGQYQGGPSLSYYINRVDNSNPPNQIRINGITDDINNDNFNFNILYNPYLKNQQWIGPDSNPVTGTNSTILYKNSCNNNNICYKCVDGGEGMPKGKTIQIWDCNGQDQQKWFYDEQTSQIKGGTATTQHKCIDIDVKDPNNPTVKEGNKLQIWDCNKYPNQKWNVTDTDYQFKSVYTTSTGKNYCIDLNGGGMNNGNNLQIWPCD